MDLRGSSSPTSIPIGAIAIPAARQPFAAMSERPAESNLSFAPRFGRRKAVRSPLDLRHLVAVAEGVLVVMGVYVLIGAGIGLLAGSVMVGVVAGLIAGACAVGAILLIRGSAVVAASATDPVCDEKVPVGSVR